MKYNNVLMENPKTIFLLPAFYALHMIEEFLFGFVGWADRYLGEFDWTQNIIGNSGFFILLVLACYSYYKNPIKYLWLGMCGAMWVLSNSMIHISATILGHEYSPGIITAIAFYIPGGLFFLWMWSKQKVITSGNLAMSFIVGGMIFIIIPTFVRSMIYHAQLAKLFHLVS